MFCLHGCIWRELQAGAHEIASLQQAYQLCAAESANATSSVEKASNMVVPVLCVVAYGLLCLVVLLAET